MSTATRRHPDRPLTDRQQAIMEYLYETTRDTGIQPTIREVGERFGISSPNGVMSHLRALVLRGCVDLADHAPRSLRFLRRPDGTPFTGFADKP